MGTIIKPVTLQDITDTANRLVKNIKDLEVANADAVRDVHRDIGSLIDRADAAFVVSRHDMVASGVWSETPPATENARYFFNRAAKHVRRFANRISDPDKGPKGYGVVSPGDSWHQAVLG